MERQPASKRQLASIFIGFQEKNRTRMILTNHAIPPTHQHPTLTPIDTKLRERIPFRSLKHCITNILGATLQSGKTGETSSLSIFPAPPSLTNMALVRGPLSLFIFYSFFYITAFLWTVSLLHLSILAYSSKFSTFYNILQKVFLEHCGKILLPQQILKIPDCLFNSTAVLSRTIMAFENKCINNKHFSDINF